MKILVIVAKGFQNYQLLCQKLDRLTINLADPTIMTMKANGALPRRWAFENRVDYMVYQPGEDDWAEEADALVVFGEDKETKKIAEIAHEEGVGKIVTYKGEK